MPGYSGTPLVKKLGIKPGMRVRFVDAPADYDRTLGALPDDVTVAGALRGTLDFVQIFSPDQRALTRRLPAAKKALAKNGMIWVSWPKKASGVPTDLTEDVVRARALAAGLVDVKVCAVDDTWSGLKLVYRLKDR